MLKRLASLALGVALAAGGSACKKEEPKAPAPTAPAPADQAAKAPQTPPTRPPSFRRTVAPITPEEVSAMLPAPEGGRVLSGPAKAKVGERVEAVHCIGKAEPKAVAENVRNQLQAAGWLNANMREMKPDLQYRLAGQKPPYVLTGMVHKAEFPDCSAKKGEVYLTLGVHKLEPIKGQAPVGPGGQVGPGGPAGLRPPVLPPGAIRPPIPGAQPGQPQPGQPQPGQPQPGQPQPGQPGASQPGQPAPAKP